MEMEVPLGVDWFRSGAELRFSCLVVDTGSMRVEITKSQLI